MFINSTSTSYTNLDDLFNLDLNNHTNIEPSQLDQLSCSTSHETETKKSSLQGSISALFQDTVISQIPSQSNITNDHWDEKSLQDLFSFPINSEREASIEQTTQGSHMGEVIFTEPDKNDSKNANDTISTLNKPLATYLPANLYSNTFYLPIQSYERRWSEVEDERLGDLVNQYEHESKKIDWKEIATSLKNRSYVDCFNRWNNIKDLSLFEIALARQNLVTTVQPPFDYAISYSAPQLSKPLTNKENISLPLSAFKTYSQKSKENPHVGSFKISSQSFKQPSRKKSRLFTSKQISYLISRVKQQLDRNPNKKLTKKFWDDVTTQVNCCEPSNYPVSRQQCQAKWHNEKFRISRSLKNSSLSKS